MHDQNYLIIVLVVSVVIHSFQSSAIVEQRKKGGNVSFRFHFKNFSKDCVFELEQKNKIIIHFNGSSTESETDHWHFREKHNRSSVRLDVTYPESITAHLKIRHIELSDAGPYVAFVKCLQYKESKEYTLEILYPPGPASCLWIANLANLHHMHFLHGHFMLECVARIGNPQGTILCAALEEEGPVAHLPPLSSISDDMITSSFWFKHEVPVSCCSVSQIYQKHVESCQDFSSIGRTTQLVTPVTPLSDRAVNSTRSLLTTVIEKGNSQATVGNANSGTKFTVDLLHNKCMLTLLLTILTVSLFS